MALIYFRRMRPTPRMVTRFLARLPIARWFVDYGESTGILGSMFAICGRCHIVPSENRTISTLHATLVRWHSLTTRRRMLASPPQGLVTEVLLQNSLRTFPKPLRARGT
jgi:hypothetical protein